MHEKRGWAWRVSAMYTRIGGNECIALHLGFFHSSVAFLHLLFIVEGEKIWESGDPWGML